MCKNILRTRIFLVNRFCVCCTYSVSPPTPTHVHTPASETEAYRTYMRVKRESTIWTFRAGHMTRPIVCAIERTHAHHAQHIHNSLSIHSFRGISLYLRPQRERDGLGLSHGSYASQIRRKEGVSAEDMRKGLRHIYISLFYFMTHA